MDEQLADPLDVDWLYKGYNEEPGDFSVILIGKDGMEKLRTDSILTVKKLFAVIDAMPMRQREMKQDGK